MRKQNYKKVVCLFKTDDGWDILEDGGAFWNSNDIDFLWRTEGEYKTYIYPEPAAISLGETLKKKHKIKYFFDNENNFVSVQWFSVNKNEFRAFYNFQGGRCDPKSVDDMMITLKNLARVSGKNISRLGVTLGCIGMGHFREKWGFSAKSKYSLVCQDMIRRSHCNTRNQIFSTPDGIHNYYDIIKAFPSVLSQKDERYPLNSPVIYNNGKGLQECDGKIIAPDVFCATIEITKYQKFGILVRPDGGMRRKKGATVTGYFSKELLNYLEKIGGYKVKRTRGIYWRIRGKLSYWVRPWLRIPEGKSILVQTIGKMWYSDNNNYSGLGQLSLKCWDMTAIKMHEVLLSLKETPAVIWTDCVITKEELDKRFIGKRPGKFELKKRIIFKSGGLGAFTYDTVEDQKNEL